MVCIPQLAAPPGVRCSWPPLTESGWPHGSPWLEVPPEAHGIVFDSPCLAAAAKVQDFNAQDLVDTLWAMAATSRALPEVFGSLQRWQLWKDRESRSLGH